MPREPSTRRGWIKATDIDLSRAIRIEASDDRGVCTCVTCGDRHFWSGGRLHAGHFIGKTEAIRYAEMGINPQCWHCNTTGKSHSIDFTRKKTEEVAHAYLEFMLDRYGKFAVDALRRLKSESKTWTPEELRVMRPWYKWRLKSALNRRGL